MPEQNVFILSASADIGCALAGHFADDGWHVVGTYRSRAGVAALEGRPNVTVIACDVESPASVAGAVAAYTSLQRPWDLFVSAVGRLDPIGPWTSLSFEAWEKSVITNSTAQLRVLHALYPLRRPGCEVHAAFFAGGGTNNPLTNYSAYCVSKILLIKMCELLHDEVADLNAFIIGPGFVPTKIHRQTLAVPDVAGEGHAKTIEFFRHADRALTSRDLYACIGWCMEQGRAVVGGRNIAAAHDPWQDGGVALAASLRDDRDRFRLRRAGNAIAGGRDGVEEP
ncbi:MAG: SDR family oxidoreductase [Acidobacteriota bacterium]